MSRPPLGKHAMTDAERHRLYHHSLVAARDERTTLLQDNERLRKALLAIITDPLSDVRADVKAQARAAIAKATGATEI